MPLQIPPETLLQSFDPDKLWQLIEDLAEIGREPSGGVSRPGFSAEDAAGRRLFVSHLSTELNLAVRTDALGNLFARREGRHSDWPVIMTGSHLDTVCQGGKFDGPAGVAAAFEAFRVMDRLGLETDHPFELAVFSSEEPNAFGMSTFGSRGLAGQLDQSALVHLQDDTGRSLGDALKSIGGDLHAIEQAALVPGQIAFFVELHIEQMPHLERARKAIGVVTGITGIRREHLQVLGSAGHGGTTPMDARHDALCAAAELVLSLEEAARRENGRAVATAGRLLAHPNAMNIVPGRVAMDAEIRSFHAECIQRIVAALDQTAARIQASRRVSVKRRTTYETGPTTFSQTVRAAIRHAAEMLDLPSMSLVSMAGHDAGHLNRLTPAGMIFIPCRDGLSHCPEEWAAPGDLLRGAQCLLATLLLLDRQSQGESHEPRNHP